MLLLSLTALADIPPPTSYVETCTVDIQCGADIAGTTCDGWHGGREPCEALEAKGWVKMCQTWGASTWDEVFCETAPDAEAVAERVSQVTEVTERPQTLPKRRCGCAAAPAAAGWVLVPVLLWMRRRR